ncbi:hypothetical protein I8J29_21720 [Paenibacillus sp. MWE-103]|uniref:Uncharacterized protein n=1 Tax=Paenibacillus artemisiicola TaxID=1172618 RepID=A0ABS3WET0_9BACL|nr:CBO0543 family protein [Paenibacillus artemisiicola]MBO7746839.1 hypothetical protein [Paenibacillus artemisiicola]
MMLYPPRRFDANEWFILISIALVLTVCLLLPRRFPAPLTLFVYLFNVYLGKVGDFILALPPLNLYDANDVQKYEWFDMVLYFFLYPPVLYILLNLYDRWKPSGYRRVLYVAGWTLLITGLEWAASKAGVFRYHGWHLYYSVFVYAGVILLNVLALRLAGAVIGHRRARGAEDPPG